MRPPEAEGVSEPKRLQTGATAVSRKLCRDAQLVIDAPIPAPLLKVSETQISEMQISETKSSETELAETRPAGTMNCLSQYYRCPERYARLTHGGALSQKHGYFRFGEDTLYGQCAGQQPAAAPTEALWDALQDVSFENGSPCLPFDVTEVVDNLRWEMYANDWRDKRAASLLASVYYLVRPFLPLFIRKRLQKIHLRGWQDIPFPHWPVDRTVDNLLEHLLLLSLRAQNLTQIPFIWFWPEGASGCALMTHDVETPLGVDLCPMLMDLNDSFGIKASFQIIPEERYRVTPAFLQSIRDRGFEVVIHDLNHDGRLFRDRKCFVERAAKINAYGKQFGATGFRAGVLYRNQLWYDLLDFEYDMSVPNVAHLDPQRGGCCTVMPYFIGNVLEIPVTTVQDYTLFHILNDCSTTLWERQIELIMEKHGLISVVIHPDYLTSARARNNYEALLAHLSQLKAKANLWVATPGEVNNWWRQRSQMTLVEQDGQWRIEGAGKERASIAFASEQDGRLVLSLNPAPLAVGS